MKKVSIFLASLSFLTSGLALAQTPADTAGTQTPPPDAQMAQPSNPSTMPIEQPSQNNPQPPMNQGPIPMMQGSNQNQMPPPGGQPRPPDNIGPYDSRWFGNLPQGDNRVGPNDTRWFDAPPNGPANFKTGREGPMNRNFEGPPGQNKNMDSSRRFGPGPGPGPGGNMGGENFNSGGPPGPNWNFDDGDRRKEQDDTRRLNDMQRGAKQMDRAMIQIQSRFDKLSAKAIPISAEAKDALLKAKAIIEKVKSAKTAEELDSVDMGEIGDLMQDMNDGMQKAEMASQFPRILKEADRELKRQQTALKRGWARARANSKIDAANILNDWQAILDKLTQIKSQAEQKFKDGETEDAINALRDEFFGQMDDLHEKQQIFELVSNVGKMIKGATSELKMADKQIARLKKAGLDISKLQEYVTQARSKLNEIKQLSTQNPVDSDAIISAIEDMEKTRDDYDAEVAKITGKEIDEGLEIPGLQNVQTINLPKEFMNFQSQRPPMGPPGGQPMMGSPSGGMEFEGGNRFGPPQGSPGGSIMPNRGPTGDMFQGNVSTFRPQNILGTMQETLGQFLNAISSLDFRL